MAAGKTFAIHGMNPAWQLATFAGVMAIGQFSPGPDMLLLTRTALAEGARSGVLTALGIATGLSVHAAIAIGGASVAFERLPWLRLAVTWAAAIYLLWLAWRLMLAARASWNTQPQWQAAKPLERRRNPYVKGLLCNLLNPKVVVFLIAVVTPFLKSGSGIAWWPAALWVVIFIEGGVLWSLWAWLLQWRPLKDGYRRAQPFIDVSFAIVLLGLAVSLLAG